MKDVILIFDLPKEETSLRVKIHRELLKSNAKMIQHSVWKSDNLNAFIEIATFIKKSGGRASILEEKFIF